ncbi:protein translocase SEC61 complex subunit gamma [Candidatus Woesearchaeota archaeon]|nr:protein translocase SEC61 complex subunit gamma [Candidatus Woesearchaeota archaeon]
MVIAVFTKLKSFAWECKRVLTVTKKPTKAELMTVVKVSGIGIALIGLIGFILHSVNRLIFQQ